ncbi:MAG: GDSL-type esterase/lipase family protein [Pisciglobus halotolerans]|nr:GDSL-type esterase/lipase family protein [Pisciglobus halotolerans]
MKQRYKKMLIVSLSINALFLIASLVAFFQLGGVTTVKNYLGFPTADQQSDFDYIERTTLFKEEKKEQKIPDDATVFLGDSLTFRTEWSELFPDETILNRGIEGDTTQGVYDRLDDVIDEKPAKIFLLIGINDLLQGEDQKTVVKNYQRILDKLKSSLPDTKVYVQSLFPINSDQHTDFTNNQDVNDLNKQIKAIAKDKGYDYIDIHSKLMKDNQLNENYTEDGLHLNGQGYSVWVHTIQDKVSE